MTRTRLHWARSNAACDLHLVWRVEADPELKIRIVEYCRGRNLKCFCKPLRCHGDYLLEISNV
jgi:hypothetical protein